MSSHALGRLPNAPLAYVLAQVRFYPILEMEKLIPGLQSVLRKQYPRYLGIRQASMEIGPQGQITQSLLPRWEFGSLSNRQGIVLQNNSLVYHVTEYSTRKEFGQQFLAVMQTIGKLVPDILVERIGLRYIDFIIPESNERPEDYVSERLWGSPDPGLAYVNHSGLMTAEYTLAEDRLVVRYLRGMGNPMLPQDLGVSLEPSDIMKRIVSPPRETGVLDIDKIININVPYEAETLGKRFAKMHEDTSQAFNALTTEHAKTVWSKEP